MLHPVITELECFVVDEDGNFESGLIHMSDFGTIEVYEGSRECVVEPGTREIVVPNGWGDAGNAVLAVLHVVYQQVEEYGHDVTYVSWDEFYNYEVCPLDVRCIQPV